MKIEILNELLTSQKRIFMKDLTRKFDVSKNSILRYTAELRDDLNLLFDDVKLLYSEDGNYLVTTNAKQEHAYIVNRLKEHYITSSSLFLILMKIIGTNQSITQIAASLNFSPSTVYNKIAQLNEPAKPYDIEISMVSDSRFKGNEFNVRYFIYRLLLFQHKTNKDNPFNSDALNDFLDITNIHDNLLQHKNLTSSEEMRVRMLQGISLYRIKRAHQVIPENEDFLKDISFFNSSYFSLFSDSMIVSDKERQRESLIFCFLLRTTIFEIESESKKANIVANYLNSGLKIARDTEFILQKFSEFGNINFSPYTYNESYYLLLINLIYLKHINIDLSVFYEDDTLLNDIYKNASLEYVENKQRINTFLNDTSIIESITHFTNAELQQLTFVFQFIFDVNIKPKTLKVFVQFSKNIHTGPMIIHLLKTTFHPSALEIIKDPVNADLIISDTYEGDLFKADHFYFENTYNNSQYQNLLIFVSHLIHENILTVKIK